MKMEPVKIGDGIYDVGVIDWNIRDFHGYSTDIGTTYNSFLIVDEKTVLLDTVRKEFSDELIDNIAAVIDPKKIDCVISNHTEMDHSGSLARVMHKIGEDKPIYCSKMGYKNLSQAFSAKVELPSRCQRGRTEPGPTDLDVSGNPHDPLARQHVYLFERR